MPSDQATYGITNDPANMSRTFSDRQSPGENLQREVDGLHARIGALEAEKASIESFAALAAHELLEPLILTEAYAATMRERLGGDEHAGTRADLDALARNARRGRLLVETLLYNATANGQELRREPVDLDAIVRDCLVLLRPEIEACGATVDLAPLPSVVGDEAMIAGIYRNLLLNALKYSPRSGSTIHIGVVDAEVPQLYVQSDGQVIAEDERSLIFVPFSRGRGERRARGTGLGLAICRDLVTRHGGWIAVEPAQPSGNRFSFTLAS